MFEKQKPTKSVLVLNRPRSAFVTVVFPWPKDEDKRIHPDHELGAHSEDVLGGALPLQVVPRAEHLQ